MRVIRVAAGAACSLLSCHVYPAEVAQGKKDFEAQCASCHHAVDPPFAGRSATQIEITVESIKSGKTAHKVPILLTEVELADLASYLVAARSSAQTK
jgi:mono/diheme cytochrome c family protein